MTIIATILVTVVLWGLCFGTRRATLHSRELDADIRRIFEGTEG